MARTPPADANTQYVIVKESGGWGGLGGRVSGRSPKKVTAARIAVVAATAAG